MAVDLLPDEVPGADHVDEELVPQPGQDVAHHTQPPATSLPAPTQLVKT